MVKLIRKTFTLFSRQEANILSAASLLMTAVAFSRILGLMRDRLLAARFTPHELGIYYAAFRLPNMIFELLVMGALSTAFIPVFTSYLSTRGKEEANRLASLVINIGILIFAIFSLPIFLFAKEISSLLAPGFRQDEIALMTSFTRIMILAQVFPLIIGNFFTGILQSQRNFLIPSLSPIVYNLGIIAGIIVLTPFVGLYAPVIGVVIGAFLFAAVQIPAILSFRYKHKFVFSFSHPGIREVGRLMLPRTLGLAVSQIDTTVDLILASFLGAASVTIFNFAQHLQQVPIGLFGASIAQATLPTFASQVAEKKIADFKKILISSLHQIFFLVVPVSSILIVLRIPMVRLVFGASTLFDWNATVLTGKTLAYFSISLFAQSLIHLLVRAFYALHDSKTPFFIGAFSVLLNAIVSLVFILIYQLDISFLGLSTSVSSIINVFLLLIFLDTKLGGLNKLELLVPAFKIFLSATVAGVGLYIPIKLFDQLVFDTTKTIDLFFLTGISASIGITVYLFLAWFLDVPQMATVFKIFERAKQLRKGMVIDTAQEVINVQRS